MKSHKYLALTILSSILATAAFASQGVGTQSPSTSGGAAAWVIFWWWLCYRKRHNPVGGWLLYFFAQLYLGVFLTLIVFFSSLKNYDITAWEGTGLYAYFMLTTLPGILFTILQGICATALLITRQWKWVRFLRILFAVELAFVIFGFIIDIRYFEDNIPFDFMAAIGVLIWLPYLLGSKRVRRVYKTKDWPGLDSTQSTVPN